jgi:hypothetical protein
MMDVEDYTTEGLALIAYAERNGYASAVDLLEGLIERTAPVGTRIAIAVLLNGRDPEDVQAWLDDNE